MSLSIVLAGDEYKDFKSAHVERNIETACSFFEFVATVSENKLMPIHESDSVKILADGELILTGWVDSYTINYDHNSHTVNIKGRSRTQDLVDCSAPSVKEYEKIGFYALVEDVCKKFGIAVINNIADPIDPFLDIESSELGQTAFSFLEPFAKRRQVLLTDDEYGRLVITRGAKEKSGLQLKNILNGKDNNIKSGARKTDVSSLYSQYGALMQDYPLDLTDFTTIAELLEDSGAATDFEIRPARKLEFYTEEETEAFNLTDRANWEKSIRRARAFTYSCTVQGHTYKDELWKTNILYKVFDDFTQVHTELLCKRITYNYSVHEGSTTTLYFTFKTAYTLEAEKEQIILNDKYEFY